MSKCQLLFVTLVEDLQGEKNVRGVVEPDQNQKETEVMRGDSIKEMGLLLEQRGLKPTAVRRQIEIL